MAKLIGAYVTISKGINIIQKQIDYIGISAYAIFLKSQRSYTFSPLDDAVWDKFIRQVVSHDLILPYGSYLINLANPELVDDSMACLINDLERCKSLGKRLYNMHPGGDTNKLGSKSIEMISSNINLALISVSGVMILIENITGQGNTIGKPFEELRSIIDGIDDKNRIGACLDTCHLFAAGYDIRTAESFSKVKTEFHKAIGIKYLKTMHLNDNKAPLDSRRDLN
jgi:deoxyribonuclease-4